MAGVTETMISRDGDIWLVHEFLFGSEEATTIVIGEPRRILPFATWAFVSRGRQCELDLADLDRIRAKLTELERADEGKPFAGRRAEMMRMPQREA